MKGLEQMKKKHLSKFKKTRMMLNGTYTYGKGKHQSFISIQNEPIKKNKHWFIDNRIKRLKDELCDLERLRTEIQ